MRYKNLKPGCHNHKTACALLAEEFGVTPKQIESTMRVFLNGWGLKRQMKMGKRTSLAGLFLINPTWLKQIRLAQKKSTQKKKLRVFDRNKKRRYAYYKRMAKDYYRNDNMFKIYEFT